MDAELWDTVGKQLRFTGEEGRIFGRYWAIADMGPALSIRFASSTTFQPYHEKL